MILLKIMQKRHQEYLHASIDVHNRRLITEFLKDGIKGIEKLQSHCVNMAFSDKIRYNKNFQQVTHKFSTLQIPLIHV